MPGTTDPDGYGWYGRELRVARAAAEEAGEMLRARFNDVWEVRPKGDDGDVVTELDLAAERIVLGRLRDAFPGDRIWSEEAGVLDGSAARTWLVDPLDGSNNVAIGLPVYAVGIGLCVDGMPMVGVVHEPHTGSTWHAILGGGVFQGARPLDPPPPSSSSGLVVAWTQGHAVSRDDVPAAELRGVLERHTRRVLPLWAPLLGWTMLARGSIDGFVGYCAEAVDFPPGALLAMEAGAEFRTLLGGPFRVGFSGPDSTRCFVAGRPGALERLVELTSGVMAGRTVLPTG
ncbi:inositol monophosphatase family protein [Streptomyces polygonati]|uniref:Inositol monophosphatase family protein n=1 Tax=Streptomyces polygonati TaxID=1617087 RepID=A0ABV8HR44_9ACTN